MKRLVLTALLIFSLSSAVYADGTAFTPLNFNDTSYESSSSSTFTPVTTTISDEAVGNGNIQNAISQLESAQADIRNDLINYRTKYADIDSQYKLIKSERESLKKQIKTIEKRIKDIDSAKEHIKKNML